MRLKDILDIDIITDLPKSISSSDINLVSNLRTVTSYQNILNIGLADKVIRLFLFFNII